MNGRRRVGRFLGAAILVGGMIASGAGAEDDTATCVPRAVGTMGGNEGSGWWAGSIDVEGNVAVLELTRDFGDSFIGKLEIYDLSWLPTPRLLSVVSSNSPYGQLWSPEISGSVVLAIDDFTDEWLLRIIDIRDRSQPRIAATVPGIWGIGSSEGNLAAVLSRGEELVLLDVSVPDLPVELSRTPMPSGSRGFHLRDDHVFVVDSSTSPTKRLRVFNVSDPAHPRSVSELDLGEEGSTWSRVEGERLYVSGPIHYFSVVDIGDPSSPRVVSRFRPEGAAGVPGGSLMAAADLVGINGRGFHIIDVSNPTAPREIAVWSNELSGEFASGRFALGRDNFTFLSTIVDLSPCLAPPACAGGYYETIIPVVAHAEGEADVLWASDVEILSWAANGEANLEFLPDQEWRPPAARASLTGLTWTGRSLFVDVLPELLGVPAGFGALRICSPSPLSIWSTIRGRNACGQELAATVPAVPISRAIRSGQNAYVNGVQANSAKRTNFGFVNLGALESSVDLAVCGGYVPPGNYRSCIIREFRVEPGKSFQVNQPLWLGYPEEDIHDGIAWIRPSSGPIVAWSSTIDNVTGEMTFHVAEPAQ